MNDHTLTALKAFFLTVVGLCQVKGMPVGRSPHCFSEFDLIASFLIRVSKIGAFTS